MNRLQIDTNGLTNHIDVKRCHVQAHNLIFTFFLLLFLDVVSNMYMFGYESERDLSFGRSINTNFVRILHSRLRILSHVESNV